MFGYVTPLKGELKVKEYELFRAYYCGVCNSIKRDFGNIPRMTLNYDMTFLAILLDSLNKNKINIVHKNCIAHPLQKRNIVIENEATAYAAAMNISLFYFKVLDDVKDDKDLKSKFLSLTLLPYKRKFSHSVQKINDIIKENLSILSNYEDNKSFSSIDEICHPFSVIVGEILKNYPNEILNDSEESRSNLYDLGYGLGKWIYLVDALDDLKEDMEKNKFNPINYLYNTNNLSYEELIIQIRDRIEFNILSCGCRCKESLDKLSLHKNKEILENIINFGMMDKYLAIINNCKKMKGSDS